MLAARTPTVIVSAPLSTLPFNSGEERVPQAVLLVLIMSLVAPWRVATGAPAHTTFVQQSRPPQLLRLTPRRTTLPALAAGGVIWVVISARRLDPSHNTVTFGAITLREVASSDRGTRLRFALPTEMRSTSEVPPQRVGAGSYQVRVTTPLGTSNALTFTITAGS